MHFDYSGSDYIVFLGFCIVHLLSFLPLEANLTLCYYHLLWCFVCTVYLFSQFAILVSKEDLWVNRL